MNEDFVPFELAKKLKEKGFYYKCVSTYDKDGMLGDNYIQPTSIRAIGFDECLCSHNVENDGCIDAPTIPQVLKWLREVKKRFVVIHPTGHDVHYYYTVHNLARSFDDFEYTQSFATYEEAAIAGIEYVIDNLI